MGPQTVTHFDIVVLIAVCFGFVLVGLGVLAGIGRSINKSTKEGYEETKRLTRALGGLVVQETGKIRALMGR